MNAEELGRYMKQVQLEEIGLMGQAKLKQARVLVVGAGGLGCPVLQYLASCGIGTIGIVDFDEIQTSNLHRQILYTQEDVGQSKVKVAASRLREMNPFIEIIEHPTMVTAENIHGLISDYDLIVDGCDNFLTRYVVSDASTELQKPVVYGSILGFQGQIATFNYKGSKNLRDLFPEAPNPEDVPNCSENGVLGTFPGVIGTMMAQEAIKVILNLQVSIDTFLVIDTLNWNFTKLKY